VTKNELRECLEIVERGYRAWIGFLGVSCRYTADEFESFYGENVEQLFLHNALQRALFEKDTFPSLFDELPILERGAKIPPIDPLQIIWNKEWLDRNVRDDVARLLLAFIWKQGDFQKAELVLAGLSGKPLTLNGAVMHQFGKHLADPYVNPIFDQHTSRHRLLFAAFQKSVAGMSLEGFHKLFGRKRIPRTDQILGNKQHLESYLAWWLDTIENCLPQMVNRDSDASERGKAVLWSDRTMFALGKAGKLLDSWICKQEDEEYEGNL